MVFGSFNGSIIFLGLGNLVISSTTVDEAKTIVQQRHSIGQNFFTYIYVISVTYMMRIHRIHSFYSTPPIGISYSQSAISSILIYKVIKQSGTEVYDTTFLMYSLSLNKNTVHLLRIPIRTGILSNQRLSTDCETYSALHFPILSHQ